MVFIFSNNIRGHKFKFSQKKKIFEEFFHIALKDMKIFQRKTNNFKENILRPVFTTTSVPWLSHDYWFPTNNQPHTTATEPVELQKATTASSTTNNTGYRQKRCVIVCMIL